MSLFASPRRLRELGVLGMNERNVHYTLAVNDRARYPLVDNKLATKALCEKAGIPTAKILGVASAQGDVPKLVASLLDAAGFALKPARGAMGNGILVVRGRTEDGRFVRAGGDVLTRDDLEFHAAAIISGLYALGGQPDEAFAEELLHVDPSFAAIAVDGVPDIRVVVYRGVPAMAMTRLPTRASRGRANLHQGALGAGVDLATGRLTRAVQHGHPIDRHPDTLEPIEGRRLPHFAKVLEIAVRAADCTGLGYVGADVVVDASHGPLVLELNARPGLAIQLANGAGLSRRLDAIDLEARPELDWRARIALGVAIARRAGAAGAAEDASERGGRDVA